MPTEELFTPHYYGILRDSVSEPPTAYDPSSIEIAETPESAYADAQARFDRNMIRIGATNIQNGNVLSFDGSYVNYCLKNWGAKKGIHLPDEQDPDIGKRAKLMKEIEALFFEEFLMG